MRQVYGLVLWLLAPGAIAQNACSAGAGSSPAISPQNYTTVFEQMTQVVGVEHSFTLSNAPVSQFPIHVFCNGLELIPGADYQVSGKTVTVSPKNVTAASDVLTAAYTEVAPNTSGNTGGSSRALSNEAGNVLSSFLTRSFDLELGSATQVQSRKLRPLQTLTSARPRELETEAATSTPAPVQTSSPKSPVLRPVPASLRMLSDVLDQPQGSRALHRPQGRRSEATKEVGLDAIGDALTSSPFDILGSAGSLDAALNGLDRNNGEGSRSTGHHSSPRDPASLRMLRATLKGSE